MQRTCLSLPTNRECATAIELLAEEAAYAVDRFGVEVCLLILDTSDEPAFRQNAGAVARIPKNKNIVPIHLSEDDQARYLSAVIADARPADPDTVLKWMMPDGVSYGACTNRAFLIASALGCDAVHRRDSDSRYQVAGGETVFPIHHELLSLGRCAADAARHVSRVDLDESDMHKPVCMVGSAFIGEMSVDIAEIEQWDKDVYFDLVSLWAEAGSTDADKRELVEVSFKGAGRERFSRDRSTLCIVDPMTVDMCNISFYKVHQQAPLPPAVDTIGSDYPLMHLVKHARLPGVQHNRNIENFHTRDRKVGLGFVDYQFRLVKFFLSMRYLYFIYERMASAGTSLLDGDGRVSAAVLHDIVKASTRQNEPANRDKLDAVCRCYKRLGGKYADFAGRLEERGPALLEQAGQDMHDYARLIEVWPSLVGSARAIGLSGPLRVAS